MSKLLLVIITCAMVQYLPSTSFASNVTYTYDNLNRITKVDYGNGTVASYTYDNAGNRLRLATIQSPVIKVATALLNYTNQNVGTQSAAQSVTVENNGSSNLTFNSLARTGTNATDFATRNDTCSGQSIVPGGSCTVGVIFVPQSSGEKSATLAISSNDPAASTLNVALTGIGVTLPAEAPVVSGAAFTNSKRPTWTWSTGGNGIGTFRYRLGNSDLSVEATTTTSLSFTPTSDLVDGTNPLYVQESNADGNWSNSASFTTVVDTVVPTLTVSTLDNQTTNNSTLNVSGTVDDNNQSATVTINGAATTVTNNIFSQAVSLENGVNTVTIVITDAAGNSTTITRTVTLDSNAPPLTVTTPVDNSATATAQVTITGSCGDAANVTVKVNSDTPQTAAISSGSYTQAVNLSAEGQNSLTVTATDSIGNNASVVRTITYDATAPTLAITIPDADITTQSMPYTISGSVEDALTDVSLTMTVNGQTVIPTITGAEFTYQMDVVQGGAYQLVVTATDLAGNAATAIRNVIFEAYADLNNDGTTTAADALLALQMAVGKLTPDLKADLAPLVNGVPAPDGKVTAADALVILRKAVGLW